jgi:hypothetical protein
MAATEPLRHHSRDESPVRIDLLADVALTDDDAAQVFDYLLGHTASRRLLDGTRSVILPSKGSGIHGGIKIKGAGSDGSSVKLGTLHSKPYRLPRYDAEGAATIDAAKDHGRAFAGGMSYQQARQEFIVSRYLSLRGVHVFASLGYGVLRRGTFASWFCLLDTPFRKLRDWWQLTRDRAAVDQIAAAFGETQRELARHEVYLILSGMVAFEDRLVRKDFHTAHLAGLNDSFLTRLSYYLFDTNFILATLANDTYVKDIADHQRLARSTYLRALTAHEHNPADIDRFKSLLVELKYADWGMEQRIARLADDPVGRALLESFLAESGEQVLFGELPRAAPAAMPAIEARPGRLARFFRRTQ